MGRSSKVKVWEIRIGSETDEKLGDRVVHRGKRFLASYKLPIRKVYHIEGAGMLTAEKRALQMAAEEGIEKPVCLGSLWANNPYGIR
jgi:hypothetical protein